MEGGRFCLWGEFLGGGTGVFFASRGGTFVDIVFLDVVWRFRYLVGCFFLGIRFRRREVLIGD